MIKSTIQMASTSSGLVVDELTAQMNKYMSYIKILENSELVDDIKLKAMQDMSEHFEKILNSPKYVNFLESSVKTFLNILRDGSPHFIAEYNIQQVRKLILEILHRFPTDALLKPYVSRILSMAFKLLPVDNEENVLVCLKIIIELHKHYRPDFNPDIEVFLKFVKSIYSNLPEHKNKIFEPRLPIKVKDLSALNMDELLEDTFTITAIHTEETSYNLIPKAVLSLKVIQELPIIVVLMYQLYKNDVRRNVSEFIPLIMKTIVLQPSLQQRQTESFNKEIFVDFMGAQIKTLSFLAYIIKLYTKEVSALSKDLVDGILGLLTLCPMEVAHLRKELLIASRHILATDLRNQFVDQMEKLFDEQVLLGKGWTTHESLRPLAYSTLADLVHHVRTKLSLNDIEKAVHLFSKIVHDDSLATTIQTMSCKLLLNLVECIRKKADPVNSGRCRNLLMRMLEVFVLKFKTIAKIQLPKMTEKCKQVQQQQQQQQQQQLLLLQQQQQQQQQQQSASGQTTQGNNSGGSDTKTENENKTDAIDSILAAPQKEEKSKFGFLQQPNYNVSEYRSLVKTLVCGVKTITWGCSACKTDANQATVGAKQFQPHETLVFIRLVKWALKALDIYTLAVGPVVSGPTRISQQTARSKEEKEVLEHFSSVFSMMHPQTFHEIFSTTIEYVVERVYKNGSLQVVPNTLLANPITSAIFATVLVEYLLERMEEMGSNPERSALYLRLFKLVFGSVSLFPQENENMLKPHLHQIVNRSMELAMVAKEPYNYFLLLRALFRSIGGGSHDLLYQEFLPLLPNLLEGLNRLQSGLHKQQMKILFVELCLTVPVRLSSLLPYLPMLMDPLVSALNGSHVLISQGLRTLELCVDNLQHDFLYGHIQPVRAELMQALWRTLRTNDQVAQVAFKVLGKFGGGNRKMMIEPQKLNYIECDYEVPSILARFGDNKKAIEFSVEKVIETAFNALKQENIDSFYRKQAWEVIYCYLTASLDFNDESTIVRNLFMHNSFQLEENVQHIRGSSYKSIHKQARKTHQTALIGMFLAAGIEELNQDSVKMGPTLINFVRHYTMVAVAQQAGAYAITPVPNEQVVLDPLVLVDALALIMGDEDKELIKPGHAALKVILETAASLLGDKDLACRLPLIEYISEKMCALCYERAWYAKLGGCHGIKFLYDHCSQKWVYEHMFTFLKALLFVMMDLTGEVSSGALDMSKNNLEEMLVVLVSPPSDNSESMRGVQLKALCKVTHELVCQVTSPHTMVREQSMQGLRLLAEKQNKSVTEVMEPFREVLADMVPPIKHMLKHQPAIAQMGLMDGNMFCTTLTPRLFTIDMSIEEHELFIIELFSLCNNDDSTLANLSCYKSITNFTPLRMSALRVLAACRYLTDIREKIFDVLYKALEKPNAELQQTAFECMRSFIAGYKVDMTKVQETVRPLLLSVGDIKNLTLNSVKMLSYLTQLFPNILDEKRCGQMLAILRLMLDNLAKLKAGVGISRKGDEEQKIITIISIFHQTPSASSKFINQLCQLVLSAEHAMLIEASSPFREVLMKYLLRYPVETLDLFLDDTRITNSQYSRYLEYLIKHDDGKPFRDHIQVHLVHRLIKLAESNTRPNLMVDEATRNEMQYQAIRIIYLLIRKDEVWLKDQHDLVKSLKRIWCDDSYQTRHKNVDALDYNHWHEPKMLVKILLHYFCHHWDNIDLLFQLLRALCDRFIPDFQFLKDFLENTVAQNYTVKWKRSAFFLFVEQFTKEQMSQELTAKVLQLILIPCFAVGFEKGDPNTLIGTPPLPFTDNSDNIVSVFINKLIDPDNPTPFADCVRISLLQFSCLLVEKASPHIHDRDPNNKTQGFKLRRLMTFAWPCLLGKNCVDAATRYHGHLLLSHIIVKFSIHKKIVLQVFHSLVKAHGLEARNVVRQALDILTPAMPYRSDDGPKMLTHWTKKIIVEEGHSMQQLFHILQLVVRHWKIYYPIRHDVVHYMVSSIQRLGFNATASFEHRKLAVELCEVIIRWEVHGIKEDLETSTSENVQVKRAAYDDSLGPQRKRMAYESASGGVPMSMNVEQKAVPKPIDRIHTDEVLNFLLRFACQVNDSPAPNPVNPPSSSPGEMLSRRCVAVLKSALKPDVWPQPIDLKLGQFDKILLNVEQTNPSIVNICTALELLTFLLTVLSKPQILKSVKELELGITSCIKSANNKVIRFVQAFLHKLMGIFPTERTNSNMSCKHEELINLYSTIYKAISDGLANYEKNPQATSTSFYGTIMILKAACANNNSYIDLLITSFMKVLHKIAKDHLQATTPEAVQTTSDLLIVSLDLVKTRVVVMGGEMRKNFIGTILVSLIDKTQDIKVMKAIVKMLEEWIKNKNVITLSQAPNVREKSILLAKLMQFIEKRFPNELDLNAQFLELINYVYTDEELKRTELCSKLEPAFLSGLRCTQPHIRAKFFKLFDESMRRRLQERLLYITSTQKWDAIGPHYWIKQCIELLLVTATPDTNIQMSHESSILPNIMSVLKNIDPKEKEELEKEPIQPFSKHELDDLDIDNTSKFFMPIGEKAANRSENISQIVAEHFKFLDSCKGTTSYRFLVAAAQLCHMDTSLAESVWLQVFPKIWSILEEEQRKTLIQEIMSFITSSAHIIQKDCHPSAVNTFVEALSRCNPPVLLDPIQMKYIGKWHSLWHRMTLSMEQLAFESNPPQRQLGTAALYDFEPDQNSKHELLDTLGEMYSLLCEQDMWAGLWQRHAHYRETSIAIAYEQHGFFEQAQAAYENATSKYKQDSISGAIPVNTCREVLMWTNRWIRCAKELRQWSALLEYSKNCVYDPFLLLESAWRVPYWDLTKEALSNVKFNCPEEYQWKVTLYAGFLLTCNPEENALNAIKQAERNVESATSMCLQEWRRLPHIVSHIHLPYLQAAQQIMELQEANQIRKGLQQGHQNSLHDMKAIVKTWRNRLPVIADDLSHWNDIFTWRHLHYEYIIKHYEVDNPTSQTGHHPNSMLGVHAAAQSMIHFGKIARKHKLTSVCLESLDRIYSKREIPIIDCFQRIRQQVKCLLQQASISNKNEYQEGIEMLNSANIHMFPKEMIAELFALKGMLYHLGGKSDEANKSFSAALQINDISIKAWSLYGEYLEQVFMRDSRQISLGVNAIVCFLHACRHQNESKARKYLAKVLWLLSYDDDNNSLMKALDKYAVGVPPLLWLPWTPQLLNCLVLYEGNEILNLLLQVGKMFPQAVYFPIRTLYLTLRAATARMTNNAQQAAQDNQGHDQSGSGQQTSGQEGGGAGATGGATSTPNNSAMVELIKASPPMYRCSKIIRMQRDLHSTVLTSLECMADQMEWFRGYWYEEVVRQLRPGLVKCYAIAFENRESVNEAQITPHILNFVKKVVSTFGIGVENVNSSSKSVFHSAASESLARRAEATYQDPVFIEMKHAFTKDFDFSQSNALRLRTLIFKVKKWIKILENRSKTIIQSFLIEDICRYLANFTLKTAEVELPGEFLLPKHYYVRIARFMPRVDIVQKHNTAARRLFIRGHNGKIYPYLVVFNDSGLADARREERVLQLLRMMNHYLGKQKETSMRFLHFTVPRVVAVSQQIRLVEDNVASISLLDIYKKGCAKLNIEHDAPINYYYERLANVQSRGVKASHQVYRDILKGVQTNMVPRTILKQWALSTFPSATDYWQFRKMFTLQLSLACFAEYVLHLTRLNPDMMYMHQDSGLMNISYYKFDVDDSTGELDTTRPVPFRLTPNIIEYISTIGISGPLTASMIAAARCFVYPNFKVASILKPILRDEMVTTKLKKPEGTDAKDDKTSGGEQLINTVNKAVASITNRMNSLAHFDGLDSKVSTLVAAASSHDNLCRMDPSWHPWL